MCLRIFLQGVEALFLPQIYFRESDWNPAAKARVFGEWGGSCWVFFLFCFGKQPLGKCLLNGVKDEVEKSWSCGEHGVLSIGVGVEGGPAVTNTHPRSILGPGTESPLRHHKQAVVFPLSHCPPSFLASFSALGSLTPQSPDQPQTPPTPWHPSP